jgi:ATP phosphoribosyltransferase regulatory subunit
MSDSLSKIPTGMRYYFGAEAKLRRNVEGSIMSVFDGWGYEEIAVPTVDYYALFERGMGRGEAHRAFRFTDTDGRMLALRPDVTSSVARAAATLLANSARPLRFCYAAAVFRQKPRSRAEWRRQNRQVGCELIGAADIGADVESLLVAAEVLERLGLRKRYRITLNHAGIFNGIAAELGLDDEARERMRELIDKKDAAELEAFLSDRVSRSLANELSALLARVSGTRHAIEEARRTIKDVAVASDAAAEIARALDALEELWRLIEGLELAENFEIDFADVSSLDYYTGLVFRIYVAGAGSRVGSGGRYDDLTSNFGKREPAIGFVLDLDALAEVIGREESLARVNGDHDLALIEGGPTAETLREVVQRRAAGERLKLSLKDA